MTKRPLYIGGALAAVVLATFIGLYWLLATTSGARFVLGAIGVVSYQRVEGRLLDRLVLTGIHLKQPKLDAQVERLELSWEPRKLLAGDLSVQRLTLDGVRVQDDTPPSKAPQIRWPRVSYPVRRMTGAVREFRVTRLWYRHLQGTPLLVNDASSTLTFKDGLLTMSDISLTAPQGKAQGEIALGLWRTSLRIDLGASAAQPLQGMDSFSLQARLLPGRDPEQLTGPVAAAGRSGERQRLELTAELGVTRNAFNIRRLTLLRPGRRGTITGAGSMTLTATEPLFTAALTAKDLDLQQELKRPARLSGTLNFSGSASRYKGNFALSNSAPGWEAAALAADFQGGKSGVKLAPLSGTVLEGRVSGALDIVWSAGLRIRGALSGRKLNPGKLAADWRGVVNLDLAGSFNMPKGGQASGELRGKLLESRLHGQDLQGEVAGAFAGKRVRVDRLLLIGRGFDLQGSGELERRLNLVARVSDLSRLVPGTAGELNADGWVRWRDRQFAGAAKATGSNLAAGGARVATASLDATLGEGKGYPVHVTAALGGVVVGNAEVENALLTVDGTAARHVLDAQLASAGSEAHLTLAGGVADKTWRGELTRFDGHDTVGPWSLAAPAALVASSSQVRVAPLLLNGAPGERLELAADLRLRPTTGDFRASWSGLNLARANPWLAGTELTGASSGEVEGKLLPQKRLVVAGRAVAQATLATGQQRIALERATLDLKGDGSGLRAALDLWLEQGSGEGHLLFTSSRPATLSIPEQGDLRLQLANLDLALLRPMLDPKLALEGRVAGVVSGRLLPGRRLDLRGNVALDKGTVAWRSEQEAFDAAITTAEAAFNWRGRLAGGKEGAGALELNARAAAHGAYSGRGERVAISRCDLRLDADQHGTRAAFDLGLEQGGVLRAAVTSDSPATMGLPETAQVTMEWGGLDSKLVKPFLPAGFDLQGELAGQARGRLMPGQRLEMTGEAEFAQGRAQWQGSSGEINANLRSATLTFAWRGDTLSAGLDLALAEYGRAKGNLVLPLPARLPVAISESGPVQGAFVGKVQERGFLTAFMPGLLQESHGVMDLDLKLAGTWQDPKLTGRLQLSDAGAYIPSAGIRVSELQFLALLEGDQVRIDNLSALSGKGRLTGKLLVRLDGWEIDSYSGSISGENFQTVYLPELQLVTSPQMTFQGEEDRVTLKGELRVPQMLISGPPTRHIVTASGDVILEGAPRQTTAKKKFPVLVEGRIHVSLGDKVQVKASGIDAKLGGEMDLVLKGIDNISSRGEIRVTKGSYKAYGLELDIVRGRLYYVDDPVNRPTLDILALRTVGDVKAGVTVGGNLNAPAVKLYSEPSMPDVDVLAYMVLGHPLSSTSTDQASMLATAAGGLFSFGEAESVQEQIKSRLGLSVLGMQTVSTQSGLMGYKEIPVTPTGTAPAKPAQTESLLTVGKYLTPKLYLSYGRSLVTGGSLFMLRYDLFRHWQLETQSGTESGVDIYYKLEFD